MNRVEYIAGIRIAAMGEVELSGIVLRGQSLGGIRTCLEIPTWKLMVDLGSVDHNQVSMRRVLITHGHLDHLGGIANHVALRELMRHPSAQYFVPPSALEPIEKLLEVWRDLDKAPLQATLIPIEPGEVYALNRELAIEPFATQHRVESQGYLIWSTKQKLKAEYAGLPSSEIAQLRKRGEPVTATARCAEFAFSGDTLLDGVLAHPAVLTAKRLVLEATFLDDRVPTSRARELGHVHLDEIAEHAELFECEHLVLTHLSQRYSFESAAQLVRQRLPKELYKRVTLF